MASLSRGPNKIVQFTDAGKLRRTLRLGKVSQRQAEAVRLKVEKLVSAKITGHAPDDETSRWLAGLNAGLYAKLVKVGLVAPREPAAVVPTGPTLGQFLDGYTTKRTDVKPATRETWRYIKQDLVAHFGADRHLATITEGDADDFKLYLKSHKKKNGEPLAPTTVHKRLQHTRQFFRDAKRHKLIADNPFADVKSAAAVDESRKCFVAREDIDRVLEVCNPTWRMIVALSRFGGLRCPSEVLSLKWQQVDFAAGKMIVPSCKTEHHPGGASRVAPIFAALRPFLEEAFELAADGAEYVVDASYRQAAMTPKGWACTNLRTQFTRLLKRAGVQPWPRLFHAMRASCETELVRGHPLHVVAAWLGNTPKVAMKHYLQTVDEDWQRAIEGEAERAAKSAARSVETPTFGALRNATLHPLAHASAGAQSIVPQDVAACVREPVLSGADVQDWGTRI